MLIRVDFEPCPIVTSAPVRVRPQFLQQNTPTMEGPCIHRTSSTPQVSTKVKSAPRWTSNPTNSNDQRSHIYCPWSQFFSPCRGQLRRPHSSQPNGDLPMHNIFPMRTAIRRFLFCLQKRRKTNRQFCEFRESREPLPQTKFMDTWSQLEKQELPLGIPSVKLTSPLPHGPTLKIKNPR